MCTVGHNEIHAPSERYESEEAVIEAVQRIAQEYVSSFRAIFLEALTSESSLEDALRQVFRRTSREPPAPRARSGREDTAEVPE